jgi:MscS family membrane protein
LGDNHEKQKLDVKWIGISGRWEANVDVVSQWLSQMGVDPLVGAAIIAAGTIVAGSILRFLGDRISLALSRWSRLGIRTQIFDIIRLPLWLRVLAEVQWVAPPASIKFLISGFAKSALALIWMIVLGRTLGLVSSRLTGYYPGAGELFRVSENFGILLTVLLGGLLILAIWQINLTPLIASAGLLGIIVGLAAKDALSNFFGGISVLLDRPFRRGDYIVLGSGDRGKVVDIGLRSTRILTRDDVLISIPNSVIVNTKVANESAPNRSVRIRIKVSVAYTSNVRQVKETLLQVAESNPLVLREPEPRVRFRALGDWSLDFELLCWTANPAQRGKLIDEINSAVFEEFNRLSITFPFPQRDVYVHNVSEDKHT